MAGRAGVSALSRTRGCIRTKPSGVAARFPTGGNVASTQRLDPAEPGGRLYRFEDLEIKELSHRFDGLLWPGWWCWRCGGTPIQAFTSAWRRRPIAFCSSSLRLNTGPCWCSCPMAASARRHPPRLSHPGGANEGDCRHPPRRDPPYAAMQGWLAEGRQVRACRRENPRKPHKGHPPSAQPPCGPLSEAATAQIQALPLEQLEALAVALLDFQRPADLASWLVVKA